MQCSCGKTLEKIPSWMADINVEFICTNCPSRTVKSIAEIKIEPIEKEAVATAPAVKAAVEAQVEAETKPEAPAKKSSSKK